MLATCQCAEREIHARQGVLVAKYVGTPHFKAMFHYAAHQQLWNIRFQTVPKTICDPALVH